jgi:hypothetical protein
MNRRAFLSAGLGFPALAAGQVAVSIRAGLIHHVAGEVWVGERRLDPQSVRFESLAIGEHLRTGRGFVEVVLGVGRMLRLAPRSEVILLNDALDAVAFEMLQGAVYLTWSEFSGGDGLVEMNAGPTACRIGRFGAYRWDVWADSPPRLRVFEGKATLYWEGGSQTVKGKHEAAVAADGEVRRFDLADRDGFDNWNSRRMRQVRRLSRAGTRRRRSRARATIDLPDASERRAPRLGGR